jgi:hypothetical protein
MLRFAHAGARNPSSREDRQIFEFFKMPPERRGVPNDAHRAEHDQHQRDRERGDEKDHAAASLLGVPVDAGAAGVAGAAGADSDFVSAGFRESVT